MAGAPEVKVRLTAEDAGVAAAIRQLGQELKNLKAREQEAAEGAFTLSKAFEGLVALGGLIKLEEIGREALDSAVNIGKMADKTGLSTQVLSVFHKVAGDMAVSTEAVDRGITKAARSITDFEAGGKKAAAGFQILHLSAKDFAGLNADQKVLLVADRLGHLKAGLDKATAAQLIFSKGGSEMIPVLDSLAAQGFDKAAEETAKLGLLFSQDFTDSARVAKAAMQELHDQAVGMAATFEAGMMPAIADVSEGLVKATNGAEGFKIMGEFAGRVLREITFQFIWMGKTAAAVLTSIGDEAVAEWNRIKVEGQSDFAALGQAMKGHLSDAWATFQQGAKKSTDIAEDEAGRQKAIYTQLAADIKAAEADLFPSADEEARRNKARISRLRVDKSEEQEPGKIENSAAADAADRIARAQAALLEKQLQDELTVWRAFAKEREQIEKASYEQGELSTAEYYRRREADLRAETDKEIEILNAQLTAQQNEVLRLAEERDAAKSKGNVKEAGQKEAERLAALGRVDELETRINTTAIEGSTKSAELAEEKRRATEADQNAVLAFERELAELQGKRVEAAKAEMEIEVQKRRTELEKAGVPASEIDAEIAKYRELKTAVAEYDAIQTKTAADVKSFEIAKRGLEIDEKAGLIDRAQKEQKINDLIKQRVPMLLQEAKAELAAAQKIGNQDDIERVQLLIQELRNLGTESDHLKQQINESLTNGFTEAFDAITLGAHGMGQAFLEMEKQVVSALENAAAQLLVNWLTQSEVDKASKLSAAEVAAARTWATVSAIPIVGWVLAPVAAAAAFAAIMAFEQGGLVPGTTGDAVPILAHAQEMVLPADISTGLQRAISTGSIAELGSYALPAIPAATAEAVAHAGDHYQHNEYHLHHNGPDAKQVLQEQLVPMIHQAHRNGRINLK